MSKMANKLPSSIALLLLLMFMINNQSSSARNLGNTTPSHHHRHHHRHHNSKHKITFLIKDVLNVNVTTKSKPATTKVTSQLPFPKPLGLFPPIDGIPIYESDPSVPVPGLSTQTLDVSNFGLFFPPRATLQELEFGTLMAIDEDLFGSSGSRSQEVLGTAQGIYVASSEDGTSHMMAMTASFANGSEFKDGLRFFGVHRKDGAESHIAVIGGTGKYDGANGYATVKAVSAGSAAGLEQDANKFLMFNVYLS